MPKDLPHAAGLLIMMSVFALASVPGTAAAQSKKIVCWKDSSGKVIGCGDKVPPEYQSSATKELDSRGITRRTTESVEQTNQRRVREEEAARLKAEEERKALDQKRQDTALLQTYSNEKEIDLKRDRDIANVDLQIEQLNTALKSSTQRYNEVRWHFSAAEKANKVSPALKDEFAKASADKERLEKSIQAKQADKDQLRQRYAEYRKRYTELRSGTASAQQTAAKK